MIQILQDSMNATQPIIRFPRAIIASCAREQIEEKLGRVVVECRGSNQAVPEPLLRRIAWHPALAAQLLCANLLTAKEIELLLADSDAACSILLENYAALCKLIEPRLLKHPPSVERVLTDQRLTHRNGLRTETEYLRHLQSDADRRYRLNPVIDRPIVLASLRDESEMRWAESPAMAFFYLATHEKIPVNSQLASILRENEEYLYLTLRLALGRRRPKSELALLGGFHTPAWAFHVLRDHLLPECESALIAIVESHPAWAAQWWQMSGWDGAKLEKSYARVAMNCARHELAPELYWFFRTIASGLTAQPAAA
jgi:hypothetical protein